jgi:hypothetical protein
MLSISPDSKYLTGYRVKLFFQIGLHSKDKVLLEQIQSNFGVGKINKHGPESIQLRVGSIKELEVIINHFDKLPSPSLMGGTGGGRPSLPLITQKGSDFQLLKQAYEIIKNKRHLTSEGLKQLVAIKSSMNLGLSDSLKAAFPDVLPK